MDTINEGLRAERGDGLLHGYRVVAIDGTNIILERSAKVRAMYPCGTNSVGKVNHPDLLTVFATDVVSGVTSNPEFGPMRGKNATSEAKLGGQVIEKLAPGTVVIGDINFGIFSVISHADRHKQKVVFRLLESRANKFLVGEKKTGTIDKKVTWTKSSHDKMLSDEDPTEVEGRFIRATLNTPGYRPMTLMFFTTVHDLTVEQIVELYGKRVHVETDIRYLKKMFKVERLQSRTPDNIAKEVLIRFCAFNLTRRVLANVATLVGLQPRQISFTHALRYISVFGIQIQQAKSELKRQELFQDFLIVMRQGKLPNRKKQRHEPRQVTHKGETFPLLRKSRTAALKTLNIKIAKNGDSM